MKQKPIKCLLFVYLASQVGYYIFAPLYAIFARNLDLSPKSISYIWGLYSLSTAVFILIFGRLENAMKKGKIIAIGYVILATSSLSFLLVHNVNTLVLVLLVSSLGTGIAMPAYKTLYAKSEKRGKESQQWSWLDAGNMFAAAIGAGIGGLIVGTYGFHGLFVAMALIQLLASVVAYRVLKHA